MSSSSSIKLFAMRDTMEIENGNGVIATVRRLVLPGSAQVRHRPRRRAAAGSDRELHRQGLGIERRRPGRWQDLPSLVLHQGRLRGRGGAWRGRRARHRHRGVHRPDPRGRDARTSRERSAFGGGFGRSLARNLGPARADGTPPGAGSSPAGNLSPAGHTFPHPPARGGAAPDNAKDPVPSSCTSFALTALAEWGAAIGGYRRPQAPGLLGFAGGGLGDVLRVLGPVLPGRARVEMAPVHGDLGNPGVAD